jgi:hypothetical protein
VKPGFLTDIDCGPVVALPRDMSPRQYYRGRKGGRPFILMHYMEEDAAAREQLRQFIQIGEWLNAQGAKAPALYELHEAQACALFEDFGDLTFRRTLHSGDGPGMEALYLLACDVLRHLARCDVPAWVPPYKASKIHRDLLQVLEYYLPLLRGEMPSEAMMADYLGVWDGIERSIPPCPQVFLHVDYHLDNLMWLPAEEGIRRCGLLDFQDALRGPLPYDLANLLEDARTDVPEGFQAVVLDRFCQDMSAAEREVFDGWYRVMGTQFHCRVIGLFIKQAAEKNRDDYLVHMNRMQTYLKTRMAAPVLAPLKEWFIKEGIDFEPFTDLNGDGVREVFRRVKSK